MPLYTPFVERNIDKVAGSMMQAEQSKLAQSAYMGDSEALGQLYGSNPQLAQRITQQKEQQKQNEIANRANQQKRTREADKHTQEIARQVAKDVSRMDFDSAQNYVAQQAQAYGVDLPPLTPEQHEQFKQAFSSDGDTSEIKNRKDLINRLPKDESGNLITDPKKMNAEQRAAMIEARILPGAVGSSAITTATQDLTSQVAGSEAIIAGEKATAAELAKSEVKLEFEPKIASAVAKARKIAAEKGDVLTDLSRMQAAMPGLEDAVSQLRELSTIATSTFSGSLWDAAVKETGFGATKGSTAKAKFISIINNQVLPLLKPTFGGSFSVQEGESLKATMGDADASPQEKMAQLDAFIAQKVRDIETKQRQLGTQPQGGTYTSKSNITFTVK